MEVSFRVSGTPDEQLLKWLTAEEDRVLRGHLCGADCSNSPQSEDLIHVKRLRLLEVDTPGWAHNLKEAAEAEVLRKLAAESDRKAREAKGKRSWRSCGRGREGSRIYRQFKLNGLQQGEEEEEKEKERQEKEEKRQVMEGGRKEGVETPFPVHRPGPRRQYSTGSHEEGPQGHAEKERRVRRDDGQQQRGQPIGEHGRRALRGLSQDPEGSCQRARGLVVSDDTKHVKVFVDSTRSTSCPSRRSSTCHMSPIPQASSGRAPFSAPRKGEPQHLLSGGRSPRRASSTGFGHTASKRHVFGGLGRRHLLGIGPKTRVDTSGVLPTRRPRGEQVCQSRVTGGAEEQAGQPAHLFSRKERQQEFRQAKDRREQGQGQERQRWQRQEGSRKGEGQMTSPLVALTDDFIAAELQRIDGEVNDGENGASSKMPETYLGERTYDHPEASILALTEQEERAGSDCNSLQAELIEPVKKDLKGLRFADVVGGLVGELSTVFRKTSSPGEIFPLPVDSIMDQPSLVHLSQEVRMVLRAVVMSLNDVYDCRPRRDQKVSPLHVRVFMLLGEEVGRYLEKLPCFGELSWKEFLRVRSIDYKGEEVKTAQQTSWANLAPALPL